MDLFYHLFKTIFIGVIILVTESSYAQNRTIEVNVTANFVPELALGLIMSGGKTEQVLNARTEQIGEERLLISFPYDPQKIETGTLASAMLVGPNGELAFGDVKMITGSLSAKSFLTLPECSKEIDVPEGLNDQIGVLQSLVEIRAARREAYQHQLELTLSGPFLEKLRRLEKGFGLEHAIPLSPNLNAFELTDRLSRLATAIKNYQNNKNSANSSTN